MKNQTKFKETNIGKIPEDWEEIKVEDVCDITSSRRIFLKEYVREGIPFYRSKEIIQKSKNKTVTDSLYISDERYKEIKSKYGVPKEGDILLTSVGTLGIAYIVKPNEVFYFKDGNLTWFKNFRNSDSNKFLFYWLQSKSAKEQIDKIAIGSTQKAVTIGSLKRMTLALPNIDEQKRIVKFLFDLDLRIELNQRMNKTLEAMGQAIFKHWFVDFEFPNAEGKPYKSSGGEMVDSELGQISKGWKVGKVEDILSKLESGSRPKGGISAYEEGVPSIGAENILGLGKYDYSKTKFVPIEFFNQMKTGIVKSGDVLLYKDGAQLGRKSIFMNSFPFEKCCVNEHVFILRTNERISPAYLYFWLNQEWMTDAIRNLNTNSAQPGINQTGVNSLTILIPERNIISKFNNLVVPLISKIFDNCLENQQLAQIRDSLLPKLMSGEIRVPIEVK